MAIKTLVFNFKKISLKFDENKSGFKLRKKKIYGIQLLEFQTDFGLRDSRNKAYLCIPVKIVKDETKRNMKSDKLEIEGVLKFKMNIQDNDKSNFEKALKKGCIIFNSIGLNTTNTPGLEYAVFSVVNSNINKTKKFLNIDI